MIDDIDVRLLESRDPSRAADLISEVFSPPIVVMALLTAVSLHASPDLPSALGWVALTTTFCAAIPYLLLLCSVRAGHVADRHLVRRAQRGRPLLAALVSVLVSLVLLVWSGAPKAITALVVAFVAGLIAALPATVHWKASMHVAVVAGAYVITVYVFGIAAAWLCSPALPIAGWARVRAGRHTFAQVIGGASIGVVASAVFFILKPAA